MVSMGQPSEMQTLNYRQLFNPTRWPSLKRNLRSTLMASRVSQLFDSVIISSGWCKWMKGLSFLNVCLSLWEEPSRGAGLPAVCDCIWPAGETKLFPRPRSARQLSLSAFPIQEKNDFGLLLQFLRSHEFFCCLVGVNIGANLVNYYWLPLKATWSGIKAYWRPRSGCLKEGPKCPHVSFLSHHHHVASQMLVIKTITFKDKEPSCFFFYLSLVTRKLRRAILQWLYGSCE